jgi:RES domain-containing protein
VAQGFGRAWIERQRSALLVAPSVVTGGRDSNVVVIPEHPDVGRTVVGTGGKVMLDSRLFGR